MININELYHYGIKGMHWGVRRFQNADGSLTAAGIKRYGIKGYSKDAYNSNKTKAGKVYDKVTNAHKYAGRMMYDLSSDSEREKQANKYLKESKKAKRARGRKIEKGAAYVRKFTNSDIHKAGQKAAVKAGSAFAVSSYFYGLPVKKRYVAAVAGTGYVIGAGGQAIVSAIDKK